MSKDSRELLQAPAAPEAPASGDAWAIYNTPTMHRKCDWLSPVLTGLAVVGASAQNISLGLWIVSFGGEIKVPPVEPKFASPLFILMWASLCFALVFLVLAALHKAIWRAPSPPLRAHLGQYLAIGFLDALNGILVVYSSNPSQTPPLLQGLLPNVGILFAIIYTRIVVGYRNNPVPILAWQPLLAIGGILGGVVLSLVPTIMALADGDPFFANGAAYGLVWSLVFLVGQAPGAVLNVFQEGFLKQRKRSNIPARSKMFDMLVMLFWATLFQFLCMLFLSWIELVPNYGHASSFTGMWSGLYKTLRCYFNQEPSCELAGPISLIFIGGYFCSYFAGAGLNDSSSVFLLIASTAASPVVTIFFLAVPSLNLGNVNTPLWSVLPALVMLIGSIVFYKLWENRLKRRKLAQYGHTAPK